MPRCEICSNEVSKVYKCKSCGAKFCENCGDVDKLICEDCLAFEEELTSTEGIEFEEGEGG
ncbi:MAG: hypothetical protein QW507_01880 [Candidatus Nanoarchaeia archaeon]|nr:hypothetical protein [Candidatus Haiyanarchaeum thermophilum]MCW1302837.1 hypothetical protein [Candidatus Haiyanarchaeum thermophilum]MCW1303517.1 hypothetical protein [Candidatus Haiyanarchaeum thermophilum]MCW1306697.1 hypothetical protein [Candidatus Haiyanarchaeum thermophilum]MCW1308736.1 hypothetical protein [Candidatus Haiyanarchaeum thermophilum]